MNLPQVNFAVHDLAAGVRFYSAMFASGPAVLRPHCAKWMLNDPRLSFTIFLRDASPCVTESGQHPDVAQPLTNNGLLAVIRKDHVAPPLHCHSLMLKCLPVSTPGIEDGIDVFAWPLSR